MLTKQNSKGMDQAELNDLLGYENDYIATLFGYDDWDDLVHKRFAEED